MPTREPPSYCHRSLFNSQRPTAFTRARTDFGSDSGHAVTAATNTSTVKSSASQSVHARASGRKEGLLSLTAWFRAYPIPHPLWRSVEFKRARSLLAKGNETPRLSLRLGAGLRRKRF